MGAAGDPKTVPRDTIQGVEGGAELGRPGVQVADDLQRSRLQTCRAS